MKIKLSSFLGNHGKKFEFDYVEGQTHVTGFAQDMGDLILVEGSFKAKASTQCVRCLKDIELDVEGNFQGKFKDQKQYKEYLSTLKTECEVDIQDSFIQEVVDGEIDVTALVEEHILLEMDPYPSCAPACEDDSEISKYVDDGFDPRWQELLKIKI